ncbi:MAG: DUF1844 domain-containing protein [Acidobacteria bacterium]|nr:DUF1844 domain-containing protein [Acidobacteriota bacterium]
MPEELPLPPASFEFLIISYKTQAEMHLGLLKLSDDQPPPDVRLARHFIDMMAMLQEKTKGNLSWEEERLLNNTLTELRFRFLQHSPDSEKKSS